VQGDGYEELADVHSRALATLSQDIAAAILAETGRRNQDASCNAVHLAVPRAALVVAASQAIGDLRLEQLLDHLAQAQLRARGALPLRASSAFTSSSIRWLVRSDAGVG
jgi:hypothetical protein